jgi:hypothetical protein
MHMAVSVWQRSVQVICRLFAYAHFFSQLSGIFVITLNQSYHQVPSRIRPDPSMLSFPYLQVVSASGFDDADTLQSLSCLQLTQSGIFFPWTFPLPGFALEAEEEQPPGGGGKHSYFPFSQSHR